MNKEKKLEKTRISNYEILCMMRNCTPEQKNSLLEKIKKSSPLENFTTRSETKTLAYSIEKMKTAEYLLLNFRVDRGKIDGVEETLKTPLVIRHLTVNLDTEKKIKIKNFNPGKGQKNRKSRKSGFKTEKLSPANPSREATQKDADQSGVDN